MGEGLNKIRICDIFVSCGKMHTELGRQHIFKTSVLARFFNSAYGVGLVQKLSKDLCLENLFTPASFRLIYYRLQRHLLHIKHER